MKAKEHYDNLLGGVYAWMSGDFNKTKIDFLEFLQEKEISPWKTKIALDLGAGHGAQTAALLELGFQVFAVDFNRQLLAELAGNNPNEKLTIIEDAIENAAKYAAQQPELIVCWGDTLAHLESFEAVAELLADCFSALIAGGKLLLSFRDYSRALEGNNRFIPVKSEDSRIMTCFLEYAPEKVSVTDIVHEKTDEGWRQNISSYEKIRLSRDWVLETLNNVGFQTVSDEISKGLIKIVSAKL